MFKIQKLYSDTVIYKNLPTLNAGADPQLELFKYRKGEIIPSQSFEFDEWPESTYSRILMKIDTTHLNVGTHHLMLHLSTLSNLTLTERIKFNIHPLLEDWKAGSGNRNDIPYVRNGANWNTSDGENEWTSEYYDDNVSIEYDFNPDDDYFTIDISGIVNSWINNDYPNYGIILKFSDEIEESLDDSLKIRFYGRETNSIYEPTIISYYEDTAYDGTIFTPDVETSVDKLDFIISNIKTKYIQGTDITLNVNVVNRYTRRSYDTQLNTNNLTNILLPTTSYYQLTDTITGKPVVPMNENGTKINKSDNGYVIHISTDNILPNRFYTIQLIILDNDKKYIIDNNYNFKII